MDIKYQEQYENLGLNILHYRKREKCTQEQLAEMLSIERTHLGRIELGKGGVSLDVLFHMAELFKIPVKALFDFKD